MLAKIRTSLKLTRKKVFFFFLLFLLGGGGFLLTQKKGKEEIKTTRVKRGDLEKIVSLSGRIDAHEKATLKFQSSGLLAWVGVKEGDQVKKGQALASLDKRELRKTLEKKMADYLKTRWDWEQGREDYDYQNRWFELSDEVKRILEKNQFDLNKAVLDVELADLAVRLATITTPIEGVVTKMEAPYPGVNITPATAEIEVVNPKTVYFYAEADEEEVVDLKEGQAVKVSLDAYPGKVFSGKINRISFAPVNESGSPTYKVEINLLSYQNKNENLRLGMEGEGEVLVAKKKDVLFLPLEAVRGEEKHWVKLLLPSGEIERRTIKTGLETEEKIEITAGVKEGEKVIFD